MIFTIPLSRHHIEKAFLKIPKKALQKSLFELEKKPFWISKTLFFGIFKKAFLKIRKQNDLSC